MWIVIGHNRSLSCLLFQFMVFVWNVSNRVIHTWFLWAHENANWVAVVSINDLMASVSPQSASLQSLPVGSSQHQLLRAAGGFLQCDAQTLLWQTFTPSKNYFPRTITVQRYAFLFQLLKTYDQVSPVTHCSALKDKKFSQQSTKSLMWIVLSCQQFSVNLTGCDKQP